MTQATTASSRLPTCSTARSPRPCSPTSSDVASTRPRSVASTTRAPNACGRVRISADSSAWVQSRTAGRLAGHHRGPRTAAAPSRLPPRALARSVPIAGVGTVGTGLYFLQGSSSSPRLPSADDYARILVLASAHIGLRRVADILAAWIRGEPLRVRACALLKGMTRSASSEFRRRPMATKSTVARRSNGSSSATTSPRTGIFA